MRKRDSRPSSGGGSARKRGRERSSESRANRRGSQPGTTRLLEPELVTELEELAAASGCELLHAEFKGGVLRLFIDRTEGGVDLNDCEHVSKMASALLDVLDFSDGRYVLEVSSPGLDRELYRPRDWQRFTGHRVRVTFTDPASGDKRTVVGRLESFVAEPPESPVSEATGGQAEVLVDGGERWTLSLAEVRTARLEIEL